MSLFKVALVAVLAVGSIATAVPTTASAAPYDRHDRWDHRGDRGHHYGRRDRHRTRVCRNVRIHHHWQRVCHWEYRRW